MLPGSYGDDCDDCLPAGLRGSWPTTTTLLFSSLPFILTYFIVTVLVLKRLFPLLSGESLSLSGRPLSAQANSTTQVTAKRATVPRRISALVFASTISLVAVLTELILCEISNTLNPLARARGIQFTVSLLLFLLIIAIPFLEIQSVLAGAGYVCYSDAGGIANTGSSKRHRTGWVLQALVFASWLMAFWWSGDFLLGRRRKQTPILETDGFSLMEASLARIGVIGISIMSLLSGFASVSSPWHNFFSRARAVTEASITRKAVGLEATREMLATKQARLRMLERKMSEAPSESFLKKAIGSLRGQADHTERQTLMLEIGGLETMAASLSAAHADLKSRHAQQVRSRTATGRLMRTWSYFFSVFCMYRILTTSLTFIRRAISMHRRTSADGGSAGTPFTTVDPVDNILALLAKHYDSHLDQAAWTRQISFLLSGVILFGSFSSVMQTFHFFSRFLPSLLKTIQANLALVVAQVSGTYVISATMMLRGMMPGQVLGEGLRSIGVSKDQTSWVDGWFEKWFLAGVGITVAGIWFGKKLGAGADEWDDEYDEDGALEMGKRN